MFDTGVLLASGEWFDIAGDLDAEATPGSAEDKLARKIFLAIDLTSPGDTVEITFTEAEYRLYRDTCDGV
jgi:hypothetical protein